ncbi:hypothetical protein KMZ93_09260 [Bradyrhizobium sediminis]|uniref:Oligosaccharide repeat unit polymerase n=1 Tax=Bradyrhizobium sediminis TaxID=2840469 RepID=A0A975P1T3_9BRAD|nr:hypothetical protein [Bradyrhizobium sediminis]QWG25040.1 hypothetical protein KMZ93_09260 [Bradyrhizobium sediminis]
MFHLFFDPARSYIAVTVVVAFALISSLFLFTSFSFGYFVGVYFYTMILGYLWLSCFSDLNYDRLSAGLSAVASIIAFLLPAVLILSPFTRVYTLSAAAFDRVLMAILALGAATIVVGATYNFRLVAIEEIYDFRDKMESPTILNYLIGITSSALLPFAFAGFMARRAWWRAGAVLLLLLLLYPITLTKLALFAPLWLVTMLLISNLFETRIAAILSLAAPLLAVLVLAGLFQEKAALLLAVVNFRMAAIPSIAMDVYNDFFSRHEVTYFCQISFLKHIVSCPYQEPLSVVMAQTYKIGNFNASLFATEGIASVGLWLAPVSAFVCGLVIALGNRLSAGLPSGFILISGAILPQVLLNVPLTTALLTHGAALLFLLWYITPRAIFEQETAE